MKKLNISRFFVQKIRLLTKPYSKENFILRLPIGAKVLDYGCGNHSPSITKSLRSDLYYVGMDIQKYNLTENDFLMANQLFIIPKDEIVECLERFENSFEVLICTHVLEHVINYPQLVARLLRTLKPGGSSYFAFPSSNSLILPSRRGTLNFYDDPTHVSFIDSTYLIQIAQCNDCIVEIYLPVVRPVVPVMIGFVFEPISRLLQRNLPGTWAYHGFESILIFRRKT